MEHKLKAGVDTPGIFAAQIIITILTAFLLAFAVHNIKYFHMRIWEEKAMLGFYVFSILTLVSSLVNSWIDVVNWENPVW